MDISSPNNLIISQRRRRLVELRVSGQTLEAAASVISSEFSLPNYNRSRAYEDFITSLSKSNKLTSTEINAYRKLEEMRLDFLWEKVLPAIKNFEVKGIECGVKICRAKAQLLGLDSAMQTIVENSVKQELVSVIDQLQASFDKPTFERILNIIAMTDSPDEDDD